MSTQNKCPFCKSELVSLVLPSNPPQYRTYCPNCKKYEESNFGQQGTLQDAVQDTQNDWVKRFNDEFPCLMHFRPNKKSYGYSEVGNDVKAFIAKLLADARKEVYREIAGHFIKICGDDVLATQKEERV